MIEAKDLVLTVEKQVPGELVTNALAIKAFVEERVKDYTPEKYYDDVEAAKKDRAVLNSAAKELDTRRLALEREFMRPFDEFKIIIRQTTGTINNAAKKLDEIVKTVEERQKQEKQKSIEAFFASQNFSLVPLGKIFDQKWLNKTYKIKDIETEIKAKITKIYSDIKTLEGEEEAKAIYLDTLDLGYALETVRKMRENRERLAREKQEREEREHQEKIEQQHREIILDAKREREEEKISSLAAEALDIEDDPIIEYTLTFRGTRAQLIALRQYMTVLGIEYTKL